MRYYALFDASTSPQRNALMVDKKRHVKNAHSGPEPERVKVKGGWIQAIKKALKKERPGEGWPEVSNDNADQKP